MCIFEVLDSIYCFIHITYVIHTHQKVEDYLPVRNWGTDHDLLSPGYALVARSSGGCTICGLGSAGDHHASGRPAYH